MNIKRDLKHNNQLLDLIKSYLDPPARIRH